MPQLYTNYTEIMSHNPCCSGMAKLLNFRGPSHNLHHISMYGIFKSNGLQDAIWALRTQKYVDVKPFLLGVIREFCTMNSTHESNDYVLHHLLQIEKDDGNIKHAYIAGRCDINTYDGVIEKCLLTLAYMQQNKYGIRYNALLLTTDCTNYFELNCRQAEGLHFIYNVERLFKQHFGDN